jgi:hypothetical protein
VRAQTLALAAPLSEADCQVQSMPDASPTKWHLAHVTWFFETFVLERFEPPLQARTTRPSACCSTATTTAWATSTRGPARAGHAARAGRGAGLPRAVDEAWPPCWPTVAGTAALVELGLQHEQQHQELLLTDVLHLLSCNPLAPVYRAPWPLAPRGTGAAGLAAPGQRAWWRWGMPARALPLTTKARATATGCSPTRWPTGW